MKVYIDVFTNDEIISDSYKQTSPYNDASFSDVAFEVESRKVSKGGEDFGISANVDEDAENSTGDSSGDVETVIDIVDGFSLQEQSITKKEFLAYIKLYIKNVCTHLEEKNPSRLEPFKQGISPLIQKIVGEFDDCTIYVGANASDQFAANKAHPIVAHYVGEEVTPRFIFFKDAMREEKC